MTTVRELDPDDAAALTALYEEYPWWADREVADVEAAIANTEIPLGVEIDDELVAAARVLTDYRFYATIFDVIVAAERRGEGVGEILVEAVLAHPDLAELPGLSLLCREGLVPFYETVGFERYDPAMAVPEGGTEDLVRMTYTYDE